MNEYDEFSGDPEFVDLAKDEKEADAVEVLEGFFERNRGGAYFTRGSWKFCTMGIFFTGLLIEHCDS